MDKSSEEMLSNMKESHGDWLALKHDFDGLTGMNFYNKNKSLNKLHVSKEMFAV